MSSLNTELLELRSKLEDTAADHERELHSLRETCMDCQSRADVALKEVENPALRRQKHFFRDISLSHQIVFLLPVRAVQNFPLGEQGQQGPAETGLVGQGAVSQSNSRRS